MANHNQRLREGTIFANPFTNKIEPIAAPELLNDYDSTAEATILAGYLKTRRQRFSPEQVGKLSAWITSELNGWTTIHTTLQELRSLPVGKRSTVIRLSMLRAGNKEGIRVTYQKRTKGVSTREGLEES